MKNLTNPSFLIPACPRWVREALRFEAKQTGRPLGTVLADILADALHPDLVTLAKGRADAKVAARTYGRQHRTRAELLAELRETPIEIPRETLRAAALAPKPPRVVDPGLAGPGEDEDDALPTTPRGRRTFLRDTPGE